MALAVALRAVTMGEPTHGVWCDDCLLPSAISVRVAVCAGLMVMEMIEVTACTDCERASYEDIA